MDLLLDHSRITRDHTLLKTTESLPLTHQLPTTFQLEVETHEALSASC